MQVTAGYPFEIDLSEHSLFLYFRLREGELISAEECGMGLQDVLIMLYACVIDEAEWVLIEEPENHLHPAMQRELLRFFSSVQEKTFFLATHSSVMLDRTYVDRILQCTYHDGSIHVNDETSKSTLLTELGYSVIDNLTADVILLVEGPHDKEAVEEIIAMLPPRPDRAIRILFLGGDIMDKQDIETFSQNFDVRVMIDREENENSRRIRARVVEKCRTLEIPHLELSRYAIENYISLNAYREVFGGQITVSEIDPARKVEDQIGLNPKKNMRRLFKAMTLQDIEGTDLLAFVRAALT